MSKKLSPFKDDIFFINNNLPLGVINENFEIIDINKSALNLFKYKKGKVLGKSVLFFTKQNSFEVDINSFRALLNGEIEKYSSNKIFIDSEGKEIKGNITLSLITIKSTKFISCVFNQINKTKGIDFLNENIDTLDIILKKSPILQYVMDVKNGNRLYENINLLEYLGYYKNDYKNEKDLNFLFSLLENENIEKFIKAGKDFKKNRDINKFIETELYIHNKKGKKIWFKMKSIPLKVDNKGNKLYSYGLMEDITELKENEQKLIKQKEFTKKINLLSTQYIFITDTNSNKIVFTNNKCKEILGYTEKEFSSLNVSKIFHSDFKEKFLFYTKSIKKNIKNKPFVTDIKLNHKTKGYRWYRFSAIGFEKNKKGQFIKILETLTDINDLKQKETLIIEQQLLIDQVTKTLPATIYIADIKNSKMIYSNVVNTNILGYTDYEWTHTEGGFVHPDFKQIARNNLNKILKLKENKTFEEDILMRHKTKGYRWYRVKSKIFKRDKNNKPIQLLDSIEDIHQNKINRIKIEEEETLLKTITSELHTTVQVVDVKTKKILFNNYTNIDIIGYKKDELYKKASEIIHPNFLDYAIKESKKIQYAKLNNFSTIELLLKHKKLGYRWYAIRSKVFKRDDNNNATEILEITEDIHENKLNKLKIEAQERFLQSVTSELPTSVYIFDFLNKSILFSNNSIINILGYADKEYLKNPISIIHPDFVEKAINDSNKMQFSKTNKYVTTELLLKHKKLGYKWYKVKSKVFKRDKMGNPIQVLEITEDIHDAKINSLKLIEQNKLLDKVSILMPQYIYLIDIEEKQAIFSNNKCEQILGYSENEYYNMNANFFVHPDFITEHKIHYDSIYKSKRKNNFSIELKLNHKTKGYRWYKHKTIIFERNEKNIPIKILKTIEDIHEEKLIQIKIKEQQNKIERIASITPNIIIVKNLKNNKVSYSNFADKRFLGYNHKQWMNKGVIIHPEYKEVYDNSIELLIKNKNKNIVSFDILVKNIIGKYVWISVSQSIFEFDKKGKPIQIIITFKDINAEKLAFEKINEQQNFINNISDSIPQFLSSWDTKTNTCIYTNFDDRLIFGYTKEEFLNLGTSFIHPYHSEHILEMGKDISTNFNKDEFTRELLLKQKDGKYIWVNLKTLVTERNIDGSPKITLEIIDNINTVKTSHLKIQEQQHFIERVIDIMPSFVQVIEVEDKKVLYSNLEDRLFIGYNKDEWKNNNFSIVNKKHFYSIEKKFLKIIKEGSFEIVKEEILVKNKDNKYVWLRAIIRVFQYENKIPKQIIIILEDIHQFKVNYNKLMEQQNFIQKIAVTMPSLVQVSDFESKSIIYNNFNKNGFLGYNFKEWQSVGFEIFHKDYVDDYLIKKNNFISDNTKELMTYEVPIINKSGKYRWVQIINKIFKTHKGKATQMMSVLRDINDRKELSLKLEEQFAKNIELERFASIVSHDIKEPLRTLRNYAQILNYEHAKNLDADGKEIIDFIENSTKRMNEMVIDILNFSKIETKGNVFTKVDMNNLLNLVLNDLNDTIKKHEADIRFNKLPSVLGDQIQLRQVFQNIIANGIKFTKKRKPVIHIKSKSIEGNWQFSISDNGIGIPKDELKNIFGIFKRLHNKTEYEGQGIGLSICKRIVERHNGKIWIESELGKGTTFFFTIPKEF